MGSVATVQFIYLLVIRDANCTIRVSYWLSAKVNVFFIISVNIGYLDNCS